MKSLGRFLFSKIVDEAICDILVTSNFENCPIINITLKNTFENEKLYELDHVD